MGIYAGIVVWFVIGGTLRLFVPGFEEIGPWIGMFAGAFVWQYINEKRKNKSKEEV